MVGTVYLVDDDERFRHSLGQILSSLGLRCEEFANPESLLAVGEFERPGCLVLDNRLPGLSGLEVLRKVCDATRIPTILISAYADVKLTVAAMQAGAAAVFEKPFDDNEFISLVEHLCFQDREFSQKRRQCKQLQTALANLSEAELDVLKCMCQGLPSKAIAHALDKSTKAVERNRQTLMAKLGSSSALETVLNVSSCPLRRGSPLSCLSKSCTVTLRF